MILPRHSQRRKWMPVLVFVPEILKITKRDRMIWKLEFLPEVEKDLRQL